MWGAVHILASTGDWAGLLLIAALAAIAAANAGVWWFWGRGKDADTRSAERALARSQKANAELVVENERLAAEVEQLRRSDAVALLHERMEGKP
jgi:cell division protein FtsB